MLQLLSYIVAAFSFWVVSFCTSGSEDKENIQLLLYKNGDVLREHFVYFSIQEEGDLRFSLNSMEGDADIYIAQDSRVPTYEPETYDLQSASCGEDVVIVPKSFKRPIVVGIYGNTAHEITKYQLNVEMIPANESENRTTYSDFEDNQVPDQYESAERGIPKKRENSPVKPNQKMKNKKSYDVKSGVFGLLEIIAMVL